MVSGSANFFSEPTNDDHVRPLAKIKKKLQDEIEQLSHELNVELPKEIAVARAHGDLSENAEYKYAKERQGYVNLKITHLKKRMGDLSMLNLTNIPKDRSGYGSRLTVLDTQRDVKIDYTLVSSEEADAEKGLISTTSPIGKALLNRKVGDEIEVVTPAGKKNSNSSPGHHTRRRVTFWLFRASYSANRVAAMRIYELGSRPALGLFTFSGYLLFMAVPRSCGAAAGFLRVVPG